MGNKEPYFYRNLNIRNADLAIIQNVNQGSLYAALAVGYKWLEDRVNIGYYPVIAGLEGVISKISYDIYHEAGEVEKKEGVLKKNVSILNYQNMYSAILFL